MKDNDFDIYRSEKGPVCITTPAHRRILAALQEGERSFGDIVDEAGKAKSTVSIHLNRMADEGLVSAREDEEDARRRWFSLEADPILTASPDLAVDGTGTDGLDAEGLLGRLVGRLADAGVSSSPLFHLVGKDIGRELSDTLGDGSEEEIADQVAQYWHKWDLGDADVDGDTVTVDPADWLTGPGAHPEALFEGILEGATGARVETSPSRGHAFKATLD